MGLLEWLETTRVALFIRESQSLWVYPSVLALHTVGLGILVGLNAAIDLRLLGVAPRVPIAPLEKLYPIMWTGFWINAISGVVLFASQATIKGVQTVFYVKLAFVALGVITLWLLRRTAFRNPAEGKGRLLAATSLVVWTAAIVAGRLMAYL